MNDIWILLTGSLVAANCALLGAFLILRKMAMLGDAISHSVLPGIVIAYLVSGSRGSFPMMVGAAIFGMLATLLIETISKKGRLQEDASIGITFTGLFALGIILITSFAGNVDLDQECVLYGEIAYVPLNLVYFGETAFAPSAFLIQTGLFIVVAFFVFRAYKGLQIITFDPAYAIALGISVTAWHYGLMAAVSLATVMSFEVVGAILVVAFLVVPPATAYLISNTLPRLLWRSVVFGISAVFLGYGLAVMVNGSISASMATVAGMQFLVILLLRKMINKQSGTLVRETDKKISILQGDPHL